jgi:hypothetical protein
MRIQPNYVNFSTGVQIAEGQVVRHLVRQGGNTHRYWLKSLISQTAGSTPNWASFQVINPTTFVMPLATAQSANPTLLKNDKLIIIDTGETITNSSYIQATYSFLTAGEMYSGIEGTMVFETGENRLSEYRISNRYQQAWNKLTPNSPTGNPVLPHRIKFKNAPDDFSGFIKVTNNTAFSTVMAAYPSYGITARVSMFYPSGVTVSANYDTGSSFDNGGNQGDFFYIEYSRVGGGTLNLSKHPVNTTP